MRKPFNLRVPLLMAAALCAGIVYSTVLAYFRLSGIYILIPVLIVLAACITVAIIKGDVSKPLIIIGVIAFFLIGAVYLFAKYSEFNEAAVLQSVAVRVSGKVDEAGVTSAGKRYLILSDVTVNGEAVKGRIAAYLSENAGEYCRRGYTVNFYTQLEKQNFIEFGSVGYNACRGVKYICTVGGGMKSTYGFDLFGEINYALEKALFNNLDGETAAVCYAMLTGNTDAISGGTISAFRNGGIAHIFAVSGLHIGVLYGALTFILKKLRVNRYASTVVRIAVIFLYSGVCLFSPSSVRALVMCSVAAASGCFHRKHDSLNALALAVVILLLINPLYLYGVGFVLSFAAVLGIILLSRNLGRLFGFLPKKLSDALSAGLSAQVAVIPVQLTSFGYISVAGLVLNFIFIPLISALYILLFICACVSVLVPVSAGFLLPCAATPVSLIINVVTECGFENAVVSGNFGNLIYIPFALLFIGCSDKFNLRPLWRASYPVACALLVMITVVTVGASRSFATVEFNSGYRGGSVKIRTDSGTVLVVTENFEKRSGVSTDADVLIVLGDNGGFAAVTAIGADYDKVYMCGSTFPLPYLYGMNVEYSDSFTACGVAFDFYGDVLTADVCGTKISLVRSDGEYGAGSTGSDFELYCYRNEGAVLQTKGGDYALDICGTLRYEISVAGYNLSGIIPKE